MSKLPADQGSTQTVLMSVMPRLAQAATNSGFALTISSIARNCSSWIHRPFVGKFFYGNGLSRVERDDEFGHSDRARTRGVHVGAAFNRLSGFIGLEIGFARLFECDRLEACL
jgi:hypothetical protein